MDTDARLKEATNLVLEHWGTGMLKVLNDKIVEKNVVLTDELRRSLHFEVIQATAAGTARLLLQFEDAGRIRDMRIVFGSKMPPVQALEEYVKEVGVANFKSVPGYAPGKMPTDSIAIRRIAWGIAFSRLKGNRVKPKKWFNKPFYATLNLLSDQILEKYQDLVVEGLTEPAE